jgi:hypothetical protein
LKDGPPGQPVNIEGALQVVKLMLKDSGKPACGSNFQVFVIESFPCEDNIV